MTPPTAVLRRFLGDLLVIDGAKIFAVNVAGAGLAFVSHILFARWLTVESYGIYVFALGWLNILFIAVQAGMNLSMVRFVAEYRANGNTTAIRALLGFSNRVVLGLGLAVAAVGATVVFWFANDASDEFHRTIYGALALTTVLAMIQQRAALLQGLERVVQSSLIFEILRPLALLALVFILARGAAPDAAAVMTANLGVSIAVLAILMVYARSSLAAEPADPAADGPPWKDWLKISLPYIAVTGLTVLLTQMDILMIGHILGPEQAGLYAPAAKVALLAVFPVVAIRSRYGPMAARLFAESKAGDLQARTNMATAVSVLACIAVMAVILPGRGIILGLFGGAYLDGADVILILTAGYLVYSLMGSVEMFFLVGPFERANALVAAMTLGLNLILNLILIPDFGIGGAAAATAVAVVFRALVSTAIIRRRTGLLPWSPIHSTQA